MYDIKEYSYKKAHEIGTTIRPSTRKNKKIDVYVDDDYIISIGDSRYSDYPTYLETHGKEYANERKRLYHLRHKKDLNHFKGFMAMYILW